MAFNIQDLSKSLDELLLQRGKAAMDYFQLREENFKSIIRYRDAQIRLRDSKIAVCRLRLRNISTEEMSENPKEYHSNKTGEEEIKESIKAVQSHFAKDDIPSSDELLGGPIILANTEVSSTDCVQDPGSTPTIENVQTTLPSLDDCLFFLDIVKMHFGDSSDGFHRFLAVLEGFKSKVIHDSGVIAKVTDLFDSHPDLIRSFKAARKADPVLSQDGEPKKLLGSKDVKKIDGPNPCAGIILRVRDWIPLHWLWMLSQRPRLLAHRG